MWCKHCRQDVPAVPVASGQRVCMRCGTAADISMAAHTVGVAELAAHGVDLRQNDKPPVRKPPIDLDEWEFEQDFHHIKDLVSLATQNTVAQNARIGAAPRGVPTTALPESPGITTIGSSPTVPAAGPSRRRKPSRASSALAWFCLCMGLLAFTCGVVLMIWSFAEGQAALWNLGMPITVVGQAGLMVGLVLQLERIGQGTRYASDQLEHVDEQLANLRQTANMLGVTHGSAAQAFYAHMAEGASPNLLLADLKGQLDLLAVRMAQR